MRRALAVLAVAAALAGCATKATRGEVTEDRLEKASYADGSGNVYLVEAGVLRYRPVTPAESSSGTYSGGEPFERALSAQDLLDWTRAVDAAEKATASHVAGRVMGSGAVGLQRAGGKKSFVLAPGCPEQRAIEAVLARLRTQGGAD